MTFSFNPNIPAANNNPSVDQPDMLTNNQSTFAIINIDHNTFDQNPAGTHKRVTFSSKNTPGAQIDPASTLYTGNGTASTVAQVFYRNQNGTFHISPIKAWGFAAGTSLIGSQGFNVSTITNPSTGTFEITLVANSTMSNEYGILASCRSTVGLCILTQIIAQDVFRIIFVHPVTGSGTNPVNFTFEVLQI